MDRIPDNPYDAWKNDPTPDNLGRVVDSMDGTVNSVLANIGVSGDPYFRSRARTLVAGAVQSYNPEAGASLKTWASHQLQPLRRERRDRSVAIKVPDRAQQDAYTLSVAEREFMDTHNREPDMLELADASGIPVKRIRKVNESMRPVAAESSFEGIFMGEETDYRGEAMDYVYQDASPMDRRIIDLRTGYSGKAPLPPGEVARRLGLTPAQLSKRSAAIGLKVLELEKALSS